MFSFLLYPRKEGWGTLWWEIGGVGMRRRGGGAREGAGEMQGWIKEREAERRNISRYKMGKGKLGLGKNRYLMITVKFLGFLSHFETIENLSNFSLSVYIYINP